MVRLASRQNCPVNGFWVNVPETGFNQQYWSFTEAVAALVQHARANLGRFPGLPATDAAAAVFVDLQNAQRMLTIKGADSYVVPDTAPPPNFSFPQHGPAFAAGVKQIGAGARVILDWLGAGGRPVPAARAGARAGICATCPQNDPGDWTRFFTEPVTALLRTQMKSADDLKLHTANDDKLHVCLACKCPLKLKVHVPLAHIEKHLSEAVRAKLDPACWILAELMQSTE